MHESRSSCCNGCGLPGRAAQQSAGDAARHGEPQAEASAQWHRDAALGESLDGRVAVLGHTAELLMDSFSCLKYNAWCSWSKDDWA